VSWASPHVWAAPASGAAKGKPNKAASSSGVAARPLPNSLKGGAFGIQLSLSRQCQATKRPWGGAFSFLQSTAPFARDVTKTPLCQQPKALLLRSFMKRQGKRPLASPEVVPKRLPPVARSLPVASPKGPQVSFGRFRDDLGFRRELTNPVKRPKDPPALRANQLKEGLRKPMVLAPTGQAKHGAFLGRPAVRRARGWLPDAPLALQAPKVQMPVFSRLVPPEKPLYALKEWPAPWPKGKKLPKAKWKEQWNPDLTTRKKTPDLTPQDVIKLMKKARALVRRDKFYEALRIYNRILSEDPTHLPALRTKARVLLWLRRLKQSRSTYSDLLTHSPGDLDGYLGMGDLESANKRWKEALQWYQLYLQHRPNDTDTWKKYARAAAQAKRKKLAKAAFKKVLQVEPKNREAKAYMQNRKVKKRFLLSFTMDHRFFLSGRVGQTFEPKFGMRFVDDQFLVLLGLRIDIRHLPQATLGEIFPHAELVWQPLIWRGFKLRTLLGGSPIAQYFPQFMFDVDAEFPLPIPPIPQIKLLMGYRFYLFPTRRSHLLIPGVLVKLFNWGFRLRYFLNLNHLLTSDSALVQHAMHFQVEWQALWWLVLKAGIGFGTFADYLLNSYSVPDFGPAAGTNVFGEDAFFFNLGAQFELPKSQFLILGYRYYQESVTLFPGQPPDYQVHFHTITLAYRLYF
jgi:tetratricopeptide (TPR) repeat protein